ncbi:unnamed protein product [Notodromas monacha]|uniref:RING-type E3 ubiquitin transferase n=1 Tax=Notodromas monacha TaxID=399045 RepID=A0A7R9BDB6_9CRUS|nr:unnamed protein product [Notodromas monacha]CAG0912673.1 unnamed protein product [Notodromas monacha]
MATAADDTPDASNANNSENEEDKNSANGAFDCNICFDPAKDAVISMCGHLFCWPCLHQWLETRPRRQVCPVCKAGISKDKVIPLYGRGDSKQEDPRQKLPPRPPGQRSEPETQSGSFGGFGFDGGFQMSFGIGAFPFGFFTSSFNFGDPRPPARIGNLAVVSFDETAHRTLFAEEAPLFINFGREEQFLFPGYWTLLPIFESTDRKLKNSTRSILFLGEANSEVSWSGLGAFLKSVDLDEKIILSKCAVDRRSTVIHHYSSEKLVYPILRYGLLISRPAFDSLLLALRREAPRDAFSIDAGYEFAAFAKGKAGLVVTADERFCAIHEASERCAVISGHPQMSSCICSSGAGICSDIYVAVKTFHGHHATRVPILKRTWVPFITGGIGFFSDIDDPEVPTIEQRVPNTLKGHCSKTLDIINYFVENLKEYLWLFVVDDDTLLSPRRLCSRVQQLDPSSLISLGQRYGFSVNVRKGRMGYNYLTGGAGILLSRAAAVALLKLGCACQNADDPDDMILGACMTAAGVTVLHSDSFHQARPVDYPEEYLMGEKAITFHKFDGIDAVSPEVVFSTWLDCSTLNVGKQEL